MRQLTQKRRSIFSALPRILAPGLILSLTLGCELGTNLEDLANDLGNPKNTTAESPGKRLSPKDTDSPVYSEDYKSMSFDGNNADGAYVTAFTANDEFVIIPYSSRAKEVVEDNSSKQAREGCNLGPTDRFRGAESRSDSTTAVLDAKLAFIAHDDAGSVLRFTDFACNLVDVEVEGGSLPLATFGPSLGYVVQDSEQRLWFVDPWAADKELIAENLSALGRGDLAMFMNGPAGEKWLWTLESGELVARDHNFEEVYRAGSNVGTVSVAYAGTDRMKFIYSDTSSNRAGQLFTFSASDPESVEKFAEDACELRLTEGATGLEAIFFSPCTAGDLQLYNFEAEETTRLVEGLSAYRVMDQVETGPLLLYIKGASAGASVGPLYAQWGTQNPFFLGDNGQLDLSWVKEDGRARPVVNWTDTGGDLLYKRVEESEAKKLASNVVTVNGSWVISDFDGKNGQLQQLDGSELTPVYDAVSPKGFIIDSQLDRALFVADFDGTSGQLVLLDGTTPRKMSKDVGIGTYQFTQFLETVTALAGEESTFLLHRTDSEAEFEINRGVSNVLEVAWPEKGFLYSAPGADEPGMYFAKLIP